MQTTQVAIISDIHANLPALISVLRDINNKGVTRIFCLGDLVDFAPWGNEVIGLIQDLQIPCVLGNHDQRVGNDEPILPLAHQDAVESKNREEAILFSKETITAENKQWLANLPFELELTFEEDSVVKKILLVHATPNSNSKYLFEEDQKTDLITYLKARQIDAMVMGHTHHSYMQKHENILLINSGSVGRSKELDRKASYSMLSISEAGIDAEICKVDYPVDEVSQAIYASDIPNFYGDFLLSK